MGVQDKVTVTLTCKKCNVTERAVAVDGGSNYSPIHWYGFRSLEHFTISQTGGGFDQPEITSAVCKQCGEPAERFED